MPAYSTVQEYIWLLEEGLALKPHLVLLGFTPINDIQTNYQPLQALYQRNSRRPYAVPKNDGGFEIDNSFMKKFQKANRKPKLWRRALNWFAGPMVQAMSEQAYVMVRGGGANDPNVWLGWPYLESFDGSYGKLEDQEYQQLWADAWRVTQSVIMDMQRKSAAAGARFAMFSHVAKIEGDPEYRQAVASAYPRIRIDPAKAERELVTFGAANGIPVVSYSSAILEAARDPAFHSKLYFSMGDEHLTAKGYALAAPELARDLLAKGLASP
jgi:hypothetical protein